MRSSLIAAGGALFAAAALFGSASPAAAVKGLDHDNWGDQFSSLSNCVLKANEGLVVQSVTKEGVFSASSNSSSCKASDAGATSDTQTTVDTGATGDQALGMDGWYRPDTANLNDTSTSNLNDTSTSNLNDTSTSNLNDTSTAATSDATTTGQYGPSSRVAR
ncbi:hypothetical protein [Nonomuraea basaltis]|uniref:hypothetical protein n=1 Tax=Nonomuraea basaltis TaxID=2495887 RepID=UPI00110C6910|nr:hypothetical protein [Nonomuraea basaltis]TMR90818.1 hypothetical protein EJK15_53160 [Nonomuraea basaltis]